MREDQLSLIHGLELQGRALTAVAADTDTVSFLVGTQSLRHPNLLYKVVLDEDTGQLAKRAYRLGLGEVWHMDSCPGDARRLACTYGERAGPGGWRRAAALLSLPEGDSGPGEEEEAACQEVELVAPLAGVLGGGEPTSVTFQPDGAGDRAACLVGDRLVVADLGQAEPREAWTALHSVRGQTRVAAARFNPHRGCHQVATACGTQVSAWDGRTGAACWQLQHSSSQGNIRSLDFNPNRQYFLATAGDDGQVVVWDSREPKAPVHCSSQHSHWVWSVRYNSFHDQLLLSAGSDSRVVLNSLASLSSEPYGHLAGEEGEEGGRLPDGLVQVWTDHEDSVYTAEWSAADPWTFASLSYDGRLVIGSVPPAVKFGILNLG